MNSELEMTRHKAFFRLKEEFRVQLWDLCIDERIGLDSYELLRDSLFDAMNESFKLGEGR